MESGGTCSHLLWIPLPQMPRCYSMKMLPELVAPALCIPPESLRHFTPQAQRTAWGLWDFYFFKIIHTNGYSHKHDFNQNIASLPHQQDGTT